MRKNCFKTIVSTILAISMSGSLAGCGTSDSAKIPDINIPASGTSIPNESQEISESGKTAGHPQTVADPNVAVTDFAVTLFREAQNEGHNTLISPLSVLCALSLTANGSQGETMTQMENALGIPVSQLNEYLHTYISSLPRGEKYKLSLANSIWLKEDEHFTVNPDFLQRGHDLYAAEINQVPFNDSTLKDINQWVSDKTDGMIENILSNMSPDAVMYLVNALAFDAEWENIYYDYEVYKGIFTTEDGIRQDVQMMHSEEQTYLQDENGQGFIKYYTGQKYAFAALLPNEGISVNEYITSLNGEKLHGILANSMDTKVLTALPKFECEYNIKLNPLLQKMGMTDAFDPNTADFSAMGQAGTDPLYINGVLHKTFISVYEKGTRAGASTVVEMNVGCAMPAEEPKRVYLERPFVYMIVDCENNIPIFMGTVMDMEK